MFVLVRTPICFVFSPATYLFFFWFCFSFCLGLFFRRKASSSRRADSATNYTRQKNIFKWRKEKKGFLKIFLKIYFQVVVKKRKQKNKNKKLGTIRVRWFSVLIASLFHVIDALMARSINNYRALNQISRCIPHSEKPTDFRRCAVPIRKRISFSLF